ncbi:hypothetical protein OHD16_12335 [Sphingobacterium sp. ML3W]|uniref:hypothetical protein n=1 Tax=Sphingobacterium sp. ML3W TaxID=1538644 RepID=UPI00249CCA12|nr:hypothetical protein [Sphingobacterium sp. ML3W]WFA80745.1 hypothetical protein OGI71_05480 [Sphingobacterium sp. ML3W]
MKIIWICIQWLVVATFIVVFVFVFNSYRYLLYALICSSVLYFPLTKIIASKLSNPDGSKRVRYDVNGKRVTMQMSKFTTFVVLLVGVYVVLVSVFSVSPHLERKEFIVTHPNWIAVTPSIRNLACNIQRGKTKYAYLDLEYQFTAGKHSYSKKMDKVEKLYSFFPIIGQRRFEEMRIELLDRATKKNVAKEYLLFYNPNDPEQQKFFLANDNFYPQGSWLYNILFVYCILFLVIVIIAFLFKIRP